MGRVGAEMWEILFFMIIILAVLLNVKMGLGVDSGGVGVESARNGQKTAILRGL